jgi:hypothetical protein
MKIYEFTYCSINKQKYKDGRNDLYKQVFCFDFHCPIKVGKYRMSKFREQYKEVLMQPGKFKIPCWKINNPG